MDIGLGKHMTRGQLALFFALMKKGVVVLHAEVIQLSFVLRGKALDRQK